MPDWRQLSLADQAAWVIGSGFGAGFSPIAPGTVGSLAAAAILYGLSSLLSFGPRGECPPKQSQIPEPRFGTSS